MFSAKFSRTFSVETRLISLFSFGKRILKISSQNFRSIGKRNLIWLRINSVEVNFHSQIRTMCINCGNFNSHYIVVMRNSKAQ